MTDRNMIHIVAGCGGSGAKSAIRLTHLMAQDPRWRYAMDESVYFLLVDTDAGDLERHAREIRNTAPGVHVETLLTSEGFRSPAEIVERFRAGVDANFKHQVSGLARFAEHWWVQDPNAKSFKDAGPFRIPHVDDVTAGAGQVPMLSFLAAWQAMPKIEEALGRLFGRIADIRAPIKVEKGSPLQNFNILFLGSVAGGTGRGCVIPIAFKMKEMLARQFGGIPSISGYFLNEDCFAKRRERHEALPQMLNAMTGWSELSSWFKLYDESHSHNSTADEVSYSLPNPAAPHDDRTAVLGAPIAGLSRDGAGITLNRPFDSIGVVCRTSGSGFSPDRDDIYDMVAAGLYVSITDSSLKSKISNDGRRFFSLGTSVTEVPYEDIRRYYQDLARLDASRRVSKALGDVRVNEEAIRIVELLGFGPDALRDFLAYTSAEDPRTPMQRMAKKMTSLAGLINEKLGSLGQAMEDQELDIASEELEKLLSSADLVEMSHEIGKSYARELCETISDLTGTNVQTIANVADAVVGRLLGKTDTIADSSNLFTREGSAMAVCQVARNVVGRLSSLTEGAFSSVAIAGVPRRQDRDARAAFEGAKDREGLLGLSRRRFTDEEITEVKETAAEELRRLYAKALARAVSGRYTNGQDGLGLFQAVIDRLTRIADRADSVCGAARTIISDSEWSSTELAAQKERLFSGPRLERSISDADIGRTGYLLRRKIRPIEPEASEIRLSAPSLEAEVRKYLWAVDPISDPAAVMRHLVLNLKGPIGEARYMVTSKDDSELRPIMEAFTLGEVLRKVQDRWPGYLSNLLKQDRDRYEIVAQNFRNFFGVQPIAKEDSVSIDSGEAAALQTAAGEDFLLLGMATVAARTCRPFWRTTTERGVTPRITVQVPLNPSDAGAWVKVIKERANLPVGASGEEPITLIQNRDAGTDRGLNPYLMVVYTDSGAWSLDDVTSLDAWHSDPEVRRCLERAERKTPPSMPFQGDHMWRGYRGSGFTDPIYVFNDRIRNSRWRPWAAEEAGQTRVEEHGLLLALIYAWVGPEWFLRRKSDAKGGKTLGPLFKFGKAESIRLARRPVRFDAGYDRNEPFAFKPLQPKGLAQMPSTDAAIAKSLGELVRTIGSADASMKALREGILDEYMTFLEQVADPAGFHPKRDRKGFADLIDLLKAYVAQRIDGKLTDPEHPATSNELRGDDAAEGSATGKAFWMAVAEALDGPEVSNAGC